MKETLGRILAAFVLACTLLALMSCGGSSESTETPNNEASLIDPLTGKQYVEGIHYQKLQSPIPNASKLTFFFSPACPHCLDFDQRFTAWIETLDTKPAISWIAVEFGRDYWALLAKVHTTAILLGEQQAVAKELFYCAQEQQAACLLASANISDEQIAQWISDNSNASYTNALTVWQSDEVTQQMEANQTVVSKHNIRYVPMLVVNGQFELVRSSFNLWDDYFNLAKLLMQQSS